MATDFFQRQDKARRNTALMLLYFVLALLSLIVLTYFLVLFIFQFQDGARTDQRFILWNAPLFLGVVAGQALVVGGACMFKIAELASGGKAVALMLDGKEVQGNTRDLYERRLLNIVEEMSIASGVPLPAVFVLPNEKGINAFAAGYAMGDAVVAVSQGSLDYLTRDELQGVVAHEFSHILNGDMRLNIRLMGWIFGIMALTFIGRVLMEATARSGRRRRSSSSSKKGDGRAAMLMLGLGLYILGLVGAFFGKLIQAAINRQREYLADASAVQFTRNPDGIAGALKKIGGLKEGSLIENTKAQEVSHMWVSDAFFGKRIGRLFATHPPLLERIQRLDPSFDGLWPKVEPVRVDVEERKGPQKGRLPTFFPGMADQPFATQMAVLEEAASEVGTFTPERLGQSQILLDNIPDQLREAAQEPFSARALMYGLLLSSDAATRDGQIAHLRNEADARDYSETVRLAERVRQLDDTTRLPLLDLTLPALRQMSPRQHQDFRSHIDHLIEADQKVSTFEYTLRTIMSRRLDEAFNKKRARTHRRTSKSIATDVVKVLSRLAWEGNEREEEAEKALYAGMRAYLNREGQEGKLLPRNQCSLPEFDVALQRLAETTPHVKRRVMLGCAACILANQQVTVREAELIRAVGEIIGVPVPVFVNEE